MKYGVMSLEEIAHRLHVSVRTVYYDYRSAMRKFAPLSEVDLEVLFMGRAPLKARSAECNADFVAMWSFLDGRSRRQRGE